MTKPCTILGVLFAASMGGCFVSPGDCLQDGVQVEPCLVGARAGQTLILRATVEGNASAPVNWETTTAAGQAFSIQPNGNRLVLISLQNAQGTFGINARSQDDETKRGGAVISTRTAGYNPQPPPVVLVGGALPNDNAVSSATAAGGNLYYIAYADQSSPGIVAQGLSTPATNYFVKQFDRHTNALIGEVPNQFLGFGDPSTPVQPNVAADCAGNGYWFDDRCLDGCLGDFALFKLTPGTSTPVQPQFDFPSFLTPRIDTLTVACDGSIYFIATDSSQKTSVTRLYKMPVYGGPPVPINLSGASFTASVIDSLVVDVEGRLLVSIIAVQGPGTPDLFRLILGPVTSGAITATIDPNFNFTTDADVQKIGPLAVDDGDVIFAVMSLTSQTPGPPLTKTIRAINALGHTVYSISSYLRVCPTGCTSTECNTIVPFQRIVGIAATPGGGLRVLDNVFIPPGDPLPCQETIRLILIEPN